MTHVTYVPNVMAKVHCAETIHRARLAANEAVYQAAARDAGITFMVAVAAFTFVFAFFA